MKLETEKTEKETQLEHNLFRKREQLEADLAEVSEQDLAERLREAQEELKEVNPYLLSLRLSSLFAFVLSSSKLLIVP